MVKHWGRKRESVDTHHLHGNGLIFLSVAVRHAVHKVNRLCG